MFSKIPSKKLKYFKFDLSHEFKFSCNMGQLIPIMCRETIPGDKFKGYNEVLVRLTTQLAPVMHNVSVYFRTFFVPNRILWKNWETFIKGVDNNGRENNEIVKPYINVTNALPGSIHDYLIGCPTGLSNPLKIDAMPYRAYNLIYNYYFRDSSIQEELPISIEDGEDLTDFSLQFIDWEKDYFTSARPSAQSGSGAILPLGSTAPVRGKGSIYGANIDNTRGGIQLDTIDGHITQADLYGVNDGGTSILKTNKDMCSTIASFSAGRSIGAHVNADVNSNLYTDLSQATASSIETVRNAFKVQEYLEKLGRTGALMRDWLYSFFGVKSSDARLQEPEYVGGGRSPIIFSEVLQTSETEATPLGEQAGHSRSFGNSKFWTKYCEDYGWLMTFMYVKPRSQYFQGVERQFTRETRYDYYNPIFANLGEQAILNKEIYAQGTDEDNEVFGYTPRFQEYRSVESRVGGDFRTTYKYWHMAREFASKPNLNSDFLKCNPTKRIFATQDLNQHVLVDCANYLYALRKIPKYVIPASLN